MDISKLKVSELRAKMSELGLSTSGGKKELIARYNEHMENLKNGGDEAVTMEAVSAVEADETAQSVEVQPVQEEGVMVEAESKQS